MTPEEQLEKFVDSHTLKYVIDVLYDIARDREEQYAVKGHARRAQGWARDADRIFSIVESIEN